VLFMLLKLSDILRLPVAIRHIRYFWIVGDRKATRGRAQLSILDSIVVPFWRDHIATDELSQCSRTGTKNTSVAMSFSSRAGLCMSGCGEEKFFVLLEAF